MDAKVTVDDEDANEISDNVQGESHSSDETECPELITGVIQDCGREINSENRDSIKHKDLPVLALQTTNPTQDEFLYSDIDEKTQALLYVQTDANRTQENKSYEKTIDPFKLPGEEELLQDKYQPMKKNLVQTAETFDSALCQNDPGKHLPILPSVHECCKKPHGGKEINSAAEIVDPFNLSPEKELSRERYQPIKRKLYLNNHKKTSEDKTGGCEKTARIDVEAHEKLAADVVPQGVPETKRWKPSYRVTYVHSQELLDRCNKLIRIEGRAELVHSLINAFGLLRYLEVVPPRMARDVEILGFHCPEYITFLRDTSVCDDDTDNDGNPACKEAESYGLSYDCPLQNGIYETCCLISGGTIVAAETLINDTADVAINWYGGWHHAKRDSASGFCYINDIVLGILKLREKFDRILYVDIDLHHGDGVEEAFCMTPKVMTVSFHKYTPGFFPGSGSLEDVGTGKGKFYSVNVPLLDGIRDSELCAMFCRVLNLVREKFQPQVIVMQCGADSLSSDPMASFNLTHLGIYRCVTFILTWNLPTLLLGGGGYNFPNTAKCWTFLTSLAASKKLPQDIPEHQHLLAYGPDFEMSTTAGNRKDCNTKQYLANVLAKISRNLSNI